MTLIGGRWRLVIVHFLLAGPRRFSALRRDIPGISQKMLTTDLRALEDAGMVHREIHAQVPVKVVYNLTDAGLKLDKLVEVVRVLGLRRKEWNRQHMTHLNEHQTVSGILCVGNFGGSGTPLMSQNFGDFPLTTPIAELKLSGAQYSTSGVVARASAYDPGIINWSRRSHRQTNATEPFAFELLSSCNSW